MSIRGLIDKSVIALLRFGFFDRVVGYLSFQRRRKTRRQVEERLVREGCYPNIGQAGAFAGMQLPGREAFVDARFEKTFGAYEHELFPLVAELGQTSAAFDTLVNVGAADGFYTVGLARLFPEAKILAFEPNARKTPVLLEMARLNGIDGRVHLSGACTPEILAGLAPTGSVLVVVDVDGYEKPLLDPQVVPWLVAASLLVETHDCFVPGITELLKKRFLATHEIQEIQMSGPDYGKIRPLSGLAMHQVDAMVGSERPSLQSWLWMQPKVAAV